MAVMDENDRPKTPNGDEELGADRAEYKLNQAAYLKYVLSRVEHDKEYDSFDSWIEKQKDNKNYV